MIFYKSAIQALSLTLLPLFYGTTSDVITLHGRVVNQQNQRPVEGVTVTAVGNQVSHPDTSDSDGRFRLETSVKLGQEVRILAQKPGFKTYSGIP
jgi:hypothetical protein